MPTETVLIVVENNMVPVDRRVWYEATSLRDAGWQVHVICPAAKGSHAGAGVHEEHRVDEPENLEGVWVHRFPLTFAEQGAWSYLVEYVTAFTAIARLSWRIWRAHRFQLLHICNPPDIFFPIGLFYRLLGAKFIFDHHDLFPEMVTWRFKGWIGGVLYAIGRIAELLTWHSANIVLATNQSYRRLAIRRGKVAASKIVVVRNGPKYAEFQPVEPVAEFREGFPTVVCYVGVMGPEDGILELVETIRYVVQDLNQHEILFLLVGDGASRQEAMTYLERWKLTPYVRMPGMVRDSLLLRQYMSSADIFVSPEPMTPLNAHSTFIKVGEYMAIGKPIVAYDLEETHYTAEEAAVYVPLGDSRGFGQAIVDLVADPDRRQQMGIFGRQRVQSNLAWEWQQKQLFAAYDKALGRPARLPTSG